MTTHNNNNKKKTLAYECGNREKEKFVKSFLLGILITSSVFLFSPQSSFSDTYSDYVVWTTSDNQAKFEVLQTVQATFFAPQSVELPDGDPNVSVWEKNATNGRLYISGAWVTKDGDPEWLPLWNEAIVNDVKRPFNIAPASPVGNVASDFAGTCGPLGEGYAIDENTCIVETILTPGHYAFHFESERLGTADGGSSFSSLAFDSDFLGDRWRLLLFPDAFTALIGGNDATGFNMDTDGDDWKVGFNFTAAIPELPKGTEAFLFLILGSVIFFIRKRTFKTVTS